jgi:hypothetical protein
MRIPQTVQSSFDGNTRSPDSGFPQCSAELFEPGLTKNTRVNSSVQLDPTRNCHAFGAPLRIYLTNLEKAGVEQGSADGPLPNAGKGFLRST